MAAHTLPGLGLTGDFLDGQDNWGDEMNANVKLLTIAVNTSVLGSVANAAGLPGAPTDGDSYLQADNGHIRSWDDTAAEWIDTTPRNGWRLFREDTLLFFDYVDGAWVAEDTGPSLPAGGTTGQVLAKASDDDGDAAWVDPDAASLPAGGTAGQALIKQSDTDGDADWADIPDGLPAGGATGQVLVKQSGTDGDADWADPSGGLAVWGLVRSSDGALLAGEGCTVAKTSTSRFTVTFAVARADANYSVLFGGIGGVNGVQPYVVDGTQTVNGFSIICYNNGGVEADIVKLMFQLAGPTVGSGGASVPDGGTTGQVLTKASNTDGDADWEDPASGVPAGGTTGQVLTKQSGTDGDADWADPTGSGEVVLGYRFGSFFEAEPNASEVLMRHIATDDFTLPTDLDGSQFSVGIDPSATVDFDLQVNGSSIGTIEVTSAGAVSFTATETDITAGDIITLVAPADSAGIANCAFTFRSSGTPTATGGGLTPTTIVQYKTKVGYGNGYSFANNIDLDTAVTAGNLIVIFYACNNSRPTVPDGFTHMNFSTSGGSGVGYAVKLADGTEGTNFGIYANSSWETFIVLEIELPKVIHSNFAPLSLLSGQWALPIFPSAPGTYVALSLCVTMALSTTFDYDGPETAIFTERKQGNDGNFATLFTIREIDGVSVATGSIGEYNSASGMTLIFGS